MARRRFQNAALMEAAIEEYKEEFEGELKGLVMPSMAGLALALGFQSTSSLRNYEGYPDQDFKWVIDNARLWLEAYLAKYGKTAFDKAHVSSINPDWREKQELKIEHSHDMSRSEMLAKMDAVLEERVVNSIPHQSEEDDEWMQ